MHPLRIFILEFPHLWRTTKHLAWAERIRLWRQSYAINRKIHAGHCLWKKRARPGDASLRGACCDQRPAAFPKNLKLEDIPALHSILKPCGTTLHGYVKLYDCTICGQAWMIDWEQEAFGGTQQLRKA